MAVNPRLMDQLKMDQLYVPLHFMTKLYNTLLIDQIVIESKESIIFSLKEIKYIKNMNLSNYRNQILNLYTESIYPLHHFEFIYRSCCKKYGEDFNIYTILMNIYNNNTVAEHQLIMFKAIIDSDLYRIFYDEDDKLLVKEPVTHQMSIIEQKRTYYDYMLNIQYVVLKCYYIDMLYNFTDEMIELIIYTWNCYHSNSKINLDDI